MRSLVLAFIACLACFMLAGPAVANSAVAASYVNSKITDPTCMSGDQPDCGAATADAPTSSVVLDDDEVGNYLPGASAAIQTRGAALMSFNICSDKIGGDIAFRATEGACGVGFMAASPGRWPVATLVQEPATMPIRHYTKSLDQGLPSRSTLLATPAPSAAKSFCNCKWSIAQTKATGGWSGNAHIRSRARSQLIW